MMDRSNNNINILSKIKKSLCKVIIISFHFLFTIVQSLFNAIKKNTVPLRIKLEEAIREQNNLINQYYENEERISKSKKLEEEYAQKIDQLKKENEISIKKMEELLNQKAQSYAANLEAEFNAKLAKGKNEINELKRKIAEAEESLKQQQVNKDTAETNELREYLKELKNQLEIERRLKEAHTDEIQSINTEITQLKQKLSQQEEQLLYFQNKEKAEKQISDALKEENKKLKKEIYEQREEVKQLGGNDVLLIEKQNDEVYKSSALVIENKEITKTSKIFAKYKYKFSIDNEKVWEESKKITGASTCRNLEKALAKLDKINEYLIKNNYSVGKNLYDVFSEHFGRNEFALNESEQTMAKYRDTRTFNGRVMEYHLILGDYRLHFDFDKKSKKVHIGYFGPHLPTKNY